MSSPANVSPLSRHKKKRKKSLLLVSNGKQVRRRKQSASPKTLADSDEVRRAMLEKRAQLPIYPFRKEIVDTIFSSSSKAIVIVGATGSGKSTQIPQYLLDVATRVSGKPIIGRGQCVAITQPRRVAATTVAKRVAQERQTKLGGEVGYAVRFEDMSNDDTRIRFLTDGLLLREAMVRRDLKRYKVIILDEAHERSLHTDILLGFLKGLLRRREDLRVVVMSATLNARLFSDFFGSAPVLRIAGRQHPVRMMYACDPQPDYVEAVVTSVLQIHVDEGEKSGDILAFLTGQEEIDSVASVLRARIAEILRESPPHLRPPRLLVCPIYAAMPSAQQMRVFAPTPPQHRKVVLATNIAESSVTIPGIRFVIDTGFSKQRAYRAKTGVECLLVSPISREQAWQRSGRAGREGPGACYRLYTERSFETELRAVALPEIQRCNLCTVVLQLKATGVDNIGAFDFIEPPRQAALERALHQLLVLGALSERDGSLTALGRQMAALPLLPEYAKLLIEAQKPNFRCVSMALTLVAMLSVDSVLFYPKEKREEANTAHRRFAVYDSDHETLVNVYAAYMDAKGSADWCRKNFVNGRSLRLATRIREQLAEILLSQHREEKKRTMRRKKKRNDVTVEKSNDDDFAAAFGDDENENDDEQQTRLRQCLAASCFLGSARIEPTATHGARRTYRTLTTSQTVLIHPSSVLFRKSPPCVVYNELVLTARQYMRCVTAIPKEWLLEFAPHCFDRAARTGKRS
eukprot:g1404.t1